MRSFLEKRGIVANYLPWLLIAVAVLVILFITLFILQSEGTSLIDRIKEFFSGGKI